MFSVIKWSFEQSYAVVPTSWVARLNGTDGAFYPPNRVKERILSCEPPGDKWRHYEAKHVLKQIETFAEAEKFAANLVEASDSEQEMRKISESKPGNALGIFDANPESAELSNTLNSAPSDSSLPLKVASSLLGYELPELPQDMISTDPIDAIVQSKATLDLLNDSYDTNAAIRSLLSADGHRKPETENPHVSRLSDTRATINSPLPKAAQRKQGTEDSQIFCLSDSPHSAVAHRVRETENPHIFRVPGPKATISSPTSPAVYHKKCTQNLQLTFGSPKAGQEVPQASIASQPLRMHNQAGTKVNHTPNRSVIPRAYLKKSNEVTLQMIYETLLRQQKEVDTVKNIVMNISAKHGDDDDDFSDIPSQMETIEQLQAFDLKLKDKSYRNKVQKFMIPFLGENFKKGVKAILSSLGTMVLWSQYSLRGQRSKRAFQNLNLYSAMKKISVRCKGLSYALIDDAIGDALRRRLLKGEKRARKDSSDEETQKE